MQNKKLELSFKCLILILISVIFDQIIKIIIKSSVTSAIKVTSFINIVFVQNKGISFGLLSKYNMTVLLTVLAISITTILVYIMFREHRTTEKITYSFLISGAIGNIIDRYCYGYVVDFIDFHIGGWHFPAFNIADAFISIASFILIICLSARKS